MLSPLFPRTRPTRCPTRCPSHPRPGLRSLAALLALLATVTISAGLAPTGVLAQGAGGSVLERLMGDDSGGAASGGLLDLGDPDQPAFLRPEQAFFMDVEAVAGEGVRVEWLIQPDHYLYRGRSSITPAAADADLFDEPTFASGKEKDDAYFGLVQVWYDKGSATLPLTAELREARQVELSITYQGCADAGLCYPPITKVVQVDLPAGPRSTSSSALGAAPVDGGGAPSGGASGMAGGGASGSSGALGGGTGAAFVSEQDALASRLASGSLWLTLATFFGLGLLLTFTPCVLPMLPIISSIVVGQGQQATRARAFTLSLAYVLAMALTYTVVGVIVGLTGAGVQAALQAPGVLVATAVLFVILSLSMFGVYELAPPASITDRLNKVAGRQKGGSHVGAAGMGTISALIVSPCVAAPLAGALIYIGQTGDAVLGGAALFSLALGMGVPVLLVGTSAGQLMPRAGAWMDRVKAVFGIVLLAMALLVLERLIPAWMTVVGAAVLCIIGAVFLGALDTLHTDAGPGPRVAKGAGLVAMLYGVMLMVGASTGQGNFTQPLRGLVASAGTAAAPGQQAAHAELAFEDVKGMDGLEVALADARARQQPVMLDYYADWCVSCKEMEAFTFTDGQVIASLDGVKLLRTDVTANDARDKALLEAHGLFGPPAILFFSPAGEELSAFRVVGYQNADKFLGTVRAALDASEAASLRAAL